VYERCQRFLTGTSDALGATTEDASRAQLIDVRRAAVFEQSDVTAEGAIWRDPAQVDTWAAELPAVEAAVVYCVYEHEVSRSAAIRLRATGIDTRFLFGGLDRWRSEGRPLAARPGG
jgi:Fe-Mn family superoxide dismutase